MNKKKLYHIYHKILLLVGKTMIGKTKWYRNTIDEEAQWIIGNRPGLRKTRWKDD